MQQLRDNESGHGGRPAPLEAARRPSLVSTAAGPRPVTVSVDIKQLLRNNVKMFKFSAK